MANLQERSIPPPNHKLHLPLHRQSANNRRLHRTDQITLVTIVLQHNRKSIIARSTLLP